MAGCPNGCEIKVPDASRRPTELHSFVVHVEPRRDVYAFTET